MTRRDLLRLEVPFAVLGVGLVAAAFVFASGGAPSWVPSAPITRLGIASPLSRMTRSFVALASGDVRAAFGWHPLGPLVFAAAVAAPVVAALSWVRGGRLPLTRLLRSRPLWYVVAGAFALAWVHQIVAL